MPFVLVTAFLALALALAGCGEQACTLVGCSDSLTLNIRDATGAPVSTFNVEYTTDSLVAGFDCPDDDGVEYSCDVGSVSIPDVTGSIELQITSGNESFVGIVAPTYTVRQPNGPGCEPTCSTGQADVELR